MKKLIRRLQHKTGWGKRFDKAPAEISPEIARVLFKQNVTMVEVEVFSFCNRRCWFCPNAQIDRHSDNVYMADCVYSSIINSLAEIGYDETVTYSRYNEPLSDPIIIDRLREARAKLSGATLHLNTNGDYLTRDYLDTLYESGLRSIRIQLYLKNEERYGDVRIHQCAERLLDRLNLPSKLTQSIPGKWLEYRLKYRDMSITAYGRNFAVNGTNRGGLVDINNDYIRTSPCLAPAWSVCIDFNGKVVPCCNFRSDVPEHAEYVLGEITPDTDIFSCYANSHAVQFRRSLLNKNVKDGLCKNCTFLPVSDRNWQYQKMRDAWNGEPPLTETS
jgi:radical SAM protein with 4Fe4S-binding SPASM domain